MPPPPPPAAAATHSVGSRLSGRSSASNSLPAPPPGIHCPSGNENFVVEVVKDRLYFACYAKPPPPSPGVHYFSTDRTLVYWNFFLDFGPLNLGQTYRFCEILLDKLACYPNDRVVYYCANQAQRKANSVFLMSAFLLMYHGMNAEESFRPFQHIKLPSFHDATPCICTYDLTVLDCLRGMERARKLGFLNFDTFDVEEYEYFEKVENGDLSWVFPGRFVAFAGPHETKSNDEMYPTCVPEDYVDYFLERRVSLVVRLNKKYYDEDRFKRNGIDHVDLYYPDGSCPSDEILERFLQICESRPSDEAIAVHCKAGLGRTGSCIGAYAMKHWGFTAAEVIGWMRVARPGSVIGPQQQYLESIQERMHRAGQRGSTLGLRRSLLGSRPIAAVAPTPKTDEMELDDEKTQGDFLLSAKAASPHSPALLRKTINANDLVEYTEEEIRSVASSSSSFFSGTMASTTTSALYSLRGVARKLYTGK